MNKPALSERDICSKFITPALTAGGKWDLMSQVREEVFFTKGRVIVRGRISARGDPKRADYLLSYKPGVQLAVIEAKDNNHSVGAGMQQALEYADILDVPFVFSSNGDAFLFHDRTGLSDPVEAELPLDAFPSADELWQRYCTWKKLTPGQVPIVGQDYHTASPDKEPRYYQFTAINRTIEAITRGDSRILLVMATGTAKTFVAFQIIWRLWKAGVKKRILFLADRNFLVDQAGVNDFKPFAGKMTKIGGRKIDKSYEIYLALCQAVSGTEDIKNIYKQFSPDFFDLVIVDECHRGSAAEDSAWREILTCFFSATQIGLTATPKETKDISNIEYFGDPIYTFSLKQGIADGFLAPYKVIRVDLDKDIDGWRPKPGQRDKYGQLIESMTTFKQIIGRGTRILEDYGKTWFTIMDFKGATRLFVDPDFDGEPVQIYEPDPDDPPTPPGGDDGDDGTILVDPPPPGTRLKYHADKVHVKIVRERAQFLGADGQLSTESVKDYTRKTVRKKFALFDDFLNTWSKAEQKRAIVHELEEQGVLLEALEDAVGHDYDPFDLICHVAYDQPPLTRKERAERVRKRNYFARYGDTARSVMEALLAQYADQGLEAFESPDVLKVVPFPQMGTPVELVRAFGGRAQYVAALRDLKSQLYQTA